MNDEHVQSDRSRLAIPHEPISTHMAQYGSGLAWEGDACFDPCSLKP
jgi:hypothetical protein